MEKAKLKIGLVLPSTPGYSETFFNNKIKGLESNGFTVVLFVNSNKNKTQLTSKIITAPKLSGNFFRIFWISFFTLTQSLFFHFKATKRLYRLNRNDRKSFGSCLKNIIINSHILSEKVDWLHFGFGTMALERENVANAVGAKMAVSFRGYDHYVYPVKNKNCYTTLFSKEVKYHVLSEGMKKKLIQNGISADNIMKITPAIDADLFSKSEKTKLNPVLQMITIARLHWIKGLDSTLEALAMLKQKGVNFNYTIVGDGALKERLQFAVHQLELTNEVFFAGRLPPVEVKEILKDADIYIQYSIQEGFCNAVLEAQAMGKICIVSDAEGLSENVLDEVTGFVAPKRNPLSLANKISEVLTMSELKKNKISEKAVTRVISEFSLSKQMDEFIVFYNF